MTSTIGVILLVVFVIVCVLLILLVLIQDDGQNGMGGLLGGRGTAAFGSHSANVLTKSTTVLVALFFVLAVALALINKRPKHIEDLAPKTSVEKTESVEMTESAETVESETSGTTENSGDWWQQ